VCQVWVPRYTLTCTLAHSHSLCNAVVVKHHCTACQPLSVCLSVHYIDEPTLSQLHGCLQLTYHTNQRRGIVTVVTRTVCTFSLHLTLLVSPRVSMWIRQTEHHSVSQSVNQYTGAAAAPVQPSWHDTWRDGMTVNQSINQCYQPSELEAPAPPPATSPADGTSPPLFTSIRPRACAGTSLALSDGFRASSAPITAHDSSADQLNDTTHSVLQQVMWSNRGSHDMTDANTIWCKDCENRSSRSWDTSAPSEEVRYDTKLVDMATSLEESEKLDRIKKIHAKTFHLVKKLWKSFQ